MIFGLFEITLDLGIEQFLIPGSDKHILEIDLSLLHLGNMLLILGPIRRYNMRRDLPSTLRQDLLLPPVLLFVHLLTVVISIGLLLFLGFLFLDLFDVELLVLLEFLEVVVLGGG